MEPKKKTGYASNTQTRRLVELLDADAELRSGKFTPVLTYKTAQKRWTTIADELNSIGGAQKTWSEWRKVSTSICGHYFYFYLVLDVSASPQSAVLSLA